MKMTITNDDGSLFGEYFVTDMSQSWSTDRHVGSSMKEISVRGVEIPSSKSQAPAGAVTSGGPGFHKTYTSPALVAPTKPAPEPTFRRVGTPCPEVLDLTEEKIP